MNPPLLIVDDDEEIRTQVKWALAGDYAVSMAENRETACAAFRALRPVVTLLDLGLPPFPNRIDEGLATLEQILALDRTAKVIVISGQGERENAMSAIASGAWDFLCKPVDIEEVRLLARRAAFVGALERDHRLVGGAEGAGRPGFEGMIGTSEPMQEVFRVIRKVAPSTAPVLILGESGTGKEMAAAAIHRQSPRRDGPFVALNCSAIPEALIESELFGHEKGAFTGANALRRGLVEAAQGGTLFLDEIGDLAPAIQVKLLRFLQEQRIQRVGGRQEIPVDVRIIAATHVNLDAAVAEGRFREDLFFRLAVVVLRLPALGARGDDVLLIAQELLDRYAQVDGRSGLSFAPDALKILRQHRWPGNVRELQNRLRRAVLMADGRRITAADLQLSTVARGGAGGGLREARDAVERDLVQQALARHGGKVAPAAVDLGISRPTLYELLEKHGIQRPQLS